MQKRIVIGVAVVAAVTVALICQIVIWLLSDAPRISEEQVERIEVGMTLKEVETVLGCPSGNYTYREDFLPINMQFYETKQQEYSAPYMEWAADKPEPRYTDDNGPNRQEAIGVRVWFDEHGRVIDKCRMGYSYTFRAPSVSDRLRRQLPRWANQ